MIRRNGLTSRISLKSRVLAIALVPSFVLLAAGVGISTFTIVEALRKRDTANLLAQGYSMAVPFLPALSEERRASLAFVATPSGENREALAASRRGLDQIMSRFGAISAQVADAMPQQSRQSIGEFVSSMPKVLQSRKNIDNDTASRLEVYAAYNEVADAMITAADFIGRDSTDKETALLRSVTSDLMRLSDWLDRSNALAAAAEQTGGMTSAELAEYGSLTRSYRTELSAITHRLPDQQRTELAELTSSSAWTRLGQMEDALVTRGIVDAAALVNPFGQPVTQELPLSVPQWQQAARQIATSLSGMGLGDLGASAAGIEKQAADDALVRAIAIAVASLVLAILVLTLAVRMGNDLVRRLRGLRADTLRADERLPLVVERIRSGERVDVADEMPALAYGGDEIGEVASAFNKAQQTAVTAAAQEARLREGTNAVFLNIARRSQAVVQRQLQVLDKAERVVEDPDHVELLFQLDHLTTRERRNAENLIVLGGGQLGRQWRDGARLVDVVRSAVSETEQYSRVTIGGVPNITIIGQAVADVVHLLAELVDNAIDFSPPESRIEVRSNPVGKGTVVEIEDQGIGIETDERERYNAMFREPPDFNLMALTKDSRIGFFVVARLAHTHGIKVSLVESTYGGVRAVVLLPLALTSPGTTGSPADTNGHVPAPAVRELAVAGSTARAATNGHTEPRPAPAKPVARAEPRWPEQSADDLPPLPRRHKQASLAPQLHDEFTAEQSETDPDIEGDDDAEQVRAKLSAFQQGTRRGRADDDEG